MHSQQKPPERAAAESEQNINAQVTGFDTHVTEKTSAAETAVEEDEKDSH